MSPRNYDESIFLSKISRKQLITMRDSVSEIVIIKLKNNHMQSFLFNTKLIMAFGKICSQPTSFSMVKNCNHFL